MPRIGTRSSFRMGGSRPGGGIRVGTRAQAFGRPGPGFRPGGPMFRPGPPRPRWYGWGYGWGAPVIAPLVVPPPIMVGAASYQPQVYERGGQQYAVAWTCGTSQASVRAMRVIANLLILGVLLAFVLDPLITIALYDYIFLDDLFVIGAVAAFVVPLAIILYIVSSVQTARCSQVQLITPPAQPAPPQ